MRTSVQTSTTERPRRTPLPAIVLAGGGSVRMGRPKALLLAKDGTFVRLVVAGLRAAGVADVTIVTGAHDAEIRAEVATWTDVMPVRLVCNDTPGADQLSSLCRGLESLAATRPEAVVVTLVDHPFVAPATIAALVERFAATRAPVVRPGSQGRHGHPVVFSSEVFDQLRHTTGQGGAKRVIAAYAARQQIVDVDDEGIWTDVDTPEEYEAALRRFGGQRGA